MSAPLDRPLADTLFIQDFAAFCRTKGDEGYDYDDDCNCANAQFLRASGQGDGLNIGNIFWTDSDRGLRRFPAGVSHAAWSLPQTFSALATRLEALLTDAPVVVSQS